MLTLHRRTISTAVMTFALGGAIAGCSSDEGGTSPGINPVVGTWNAASLSIQGGSDLIAQGMGYSIVFNSNGTFASTTSTDMAGFCSVGIPDCTESGPYTASDTQITLDAGKATPRTLGDPAPITDHHLTADRDPPLPDLDRHPVARVRVQRHASSSTNNSHLLAISQPRTRTRPWSRPCPLVGAENRGRITQHSYYGASA